MSNAQGFGTPRFVKPRVGKTKQHFQWQGMPTLDLKTRTRLWQAGLLPLQLPQGVEARSLTTAEIEWLDRASKAEYIASEHNGQAAIFYTSPPPEFRLEAADWYLRPNDSWNHDPVLLQAIIEQFPADLFQLSASGQPPAFYPERTSDYTDAQERVMRSVFRETTRLGWSLPQYKWFVMEQFRKTTAQVTYDDAVQLLAQLQNMEGEIED
ncbi:MAG: hypothetical protein HC936_09940 [Leptolyngbyaceae cyanobacterium SU_3_3]|nr:hypothetical protein [Leptolyngbyaceae cyanobacterium SU_3_3]